MSMSMQTADLSFFADRRRSRSNTGARSFSRGSGVRNMSQGTIGMLNDSNADHSNILPEERLHNQTLRQFYKEFCGAIKGEGMHEVNIHDVLVRLKFISPNEDLEANHGAASS